MSKYKLEVKLRQYTPLLHFQGDTSGACLRASEVKPKLDCFVVDYLTRQNVKIPDAWIMRNTEEDTDDKNPHTALRYKMRFEGIGKPIITRNYLSKDIQNEIHPLYFASMGQKDSDVWDKNGESKTKGIFYEKGVIMTIFAPACPALLTIISSALPAFFALHGFGNRSNKGFGSFTVASMNNKTIKEPAPSELLDFLPDACKALYFAEYEEPFDKNSRLDDIQGLSAIMKGGMNYSTYNKNTGEVDEPYYFKGLIFQYFIDNQNSVHSEKALVKRNILPCAREDQLVSERYGKTPITDIDKTLYMRAVLGLGQTFEYKRNKRNAISFRKGTVQIEGKERVDDKPVIARFENPVHFKPYGRYLLLIPQEIPKKLLGSEFILSSGGVPCNRCDERSHCKMKCDKPGKRSAAITIPQTFDLDDFMQFFANEYAECDELNDFYLDPRARCSKPVRIISNLLHRVPTIERLEAKGGNT